MHHSVHRSSCVSIDIDVFACTVFSTFGRRSSGPAIDGLKEIYDELRIVNKSLGERLQSASESDSTLNAMVLLDVYAIMIPDAIEESLEDLRPLFDRFL